MATEDTEQSGERNSHDVESVEDGLTKILEILESDPLMHTNYDADLYTLWNDVSELRKEVRDND